MMTWGWWGNTSLVCSGCWSNSIPKLKQVVVLETRLLTKCWSSIYPCETIQLQTCTSSEMVRNHLSRCKLEQLGNWLASRGGRRQKWRPPVANERAQRKIDGKSCGFGSSGGSDWNMSLWQLLLALLGHLACWTRHKPNKHTEIFIALCPAFFLSTHIDENVYLHCTVSHFGC